MLTRYIRTTPTTQNRDPLYGFVDRFFNELDWARTAGESTDRGWVPPMDIVETEDAFLATADLPGLTKDQVDLSIEDGVLTLCGERRAVAEQEGQTYRRVERSFGRFERSFTLPQGIDAEKTEASLENGVLTLTLPKSAVAKARKIDIA